MNYGHRLEFGTFITPLADPPAAAVAFAQRGEELGFDLVSFQDHPYPSANLDTWALLSWVAGKTERIRIAANMVNIPLRPPAVLARAAPSLDLLANGRLDLALGAGSRRAGRGDRDHARDLDHQRAGRRPPRRRVRQGGGSQTRARARARATATPPVATGAAT